VIVVVSIIGFVVGVCVWFGMSYLLVSLVLWFEKRRPDLTGTAGVRAFEAVACALLVIMCLALAFGVARFMWVRVSQ
jgi:hypothetical protein